MPPKDITSLGEVYVLTADGAVLDWRRSAEAIRDSITVTREAIETITEGCIKLRLAVHLSRRVLLELAKLCSAARRPKLTYRTKRRNCAKRNSR